MQLQIKTPKTAKITYLEGNKQQRRYRLTYSDVSKLKQGNGWCFEDQTTGSKLTETFFVALNEQVMSASCI